jgi:pimeloyl-ACP methyl ester carboxylesterase
LRCALASIYYRFDAANGGNKLRTSVLASPNGRKIAFMDPRGVRVFDLPGGSESLIEGVRPVLWSHDSSRLYVIDTAMQFHSFAAGKVSAEPWLNETFGEALHNGQSFGRRDLFVAGHGLIAVPRASARILVANLEKKSTFSVLVGARWLSPHPYAEIAIGWNTKRDEPAMFVLHQVINSEKGGGTNPHRMTIDNRIDVYGAQGDHEFGAEIAGNEVGLVPLLLDGRALVLARSPENRCINTLDADGAVSQFGACHGDLDTVTVDRRGALIAAKTFLEPEPHNELKFSADPAEIASARLLAMLDDGTTLHLIRRPDGGDELAVVRSHSVQSRSSLPSHECIDRESFPRGAPLSARTVDGFTAQGFLFTPPVRSQVKGLVMYLHGGPREAFPDSLVNAFGRALLERGYAMVAVNYRGGTGYGRALLEKPYGGDYDGMLDDVSALKQTALSKLRLPASAPVVLRGASYGGYLAIKAAVERSGTYSTFIIESAVCRMASSVGDVSYGNPAALPLNRVNERDYALHSLRIATGVDGKPVAPDLCTARAGADAKLIVIHAEGDPVAPFGRMRAFAAAQDKDRLLTMFANGTMHDLMLEMSSDQKTFDQIVDQAVRFIEAPLIKSTE